MLSQCQAVGIFMNTDMRPCVLLRKLACFVFIWNEVG